MNKRRMAFAAFFMVLGLFAAGCLGASFGQSCSQASGRWLAEYGECELLSRETCEALGGAFEPCASACRHEAGDVLCTMQCIPVCREG